MSEWVYRDCPTCVHVDELEPEDSTNPVDWYGTLHEPIVRCRDCAKAECPEVHLLNGMKQHILTCARFPSFPHGTQPDGFCAWGERKVEG